MANKVLFIGYVWPEPRSSAAGRRILDVISLFQAQGAAVSFACAAEFGQNPADLSSLGVATFSIQLNCSSFDEQVQRLNPDIVVFDRFVCEEQFGWRVERACPKALRILDTEDLHCLRDARHKALKAGREMLSADLFSDLAFREIASIWRCDLSLMISPFEVDLLVEQFGVDPRLLFHLPLFANLAFARQKQPEFSQRQHCVVVGNFRHAPNWDAVQYLRRDIWPELRRRLGKNVQCHVYGAYQPPKAQQLHSEKEGFLLKGWAENACVIVSQARLVLAPLRFGAGQKGKLLEAMECGTPSVTSNIGIEGMASTAQWPGGVANTASDFVATAADLYTNEKQWHAAAQQCLPLLDSNFNKSGFENNFFNIINELLIDPEAHRRQFFNGMMIRQQSLRSHQYMSQWIEAKNASLRHSDEDTSES